MNGSPASSGSTAEMGLPYTCGDPIIAHSGVFVVNVRKQKPILIM